MSDTPQKHSSDLLANATVTYRKAAVINPARPQEGDGPNFTHVFDHLRGSMDNLYAAVVTVAGVCRRMAERRPAARGRHASQAESGVCS
jgi:hypothetical protein